ncbi:MAG: hypothetical protein ACPG32_03065 [Akkermansiaceae bacterium]
MIRFLFSLLVLLVILPLAGPAAEPLATASLGQPFELNDIYIKGGKVEAIPRKDRESSLVVRVLEVKSAEGGFRYDLEVYGLDPGEYMLRDFLRFKSTQKEVVELDAEVEIVSMHPLDVLPKPETIPHVPPEKMGGYKTLLIAACVVWFVILLLIFFYRKPKPDEVEEKLPPTLHEKLTGLITAASQGDLGDRDRAQLERLIIGHWKQKLPELAEASPDKALAKLRVHDEASPLILKIEQWLHAPNPSVSQQEIQQLLEPYRQPQRER